MLSEAKAAGDRRTAIAFANVDFGPVDAVAAQVMAAGIVAAVGHIEGAFRASAARIRRGSLERSGWAGSGGARFRRCGSRNAAEQKRRQNERKEDGANG